MVSHGGSNHILLTKAASLEHITPNSGARRCCPPTKSDQWHSEQSVVLFGGFLDNMVLACKAQAFVQLSSHNTAIKSIGRNQGRNLFDWWKGMK